MNILVGTWFVVSSNFPMWLKGDKLNPTFNYTLTEKKGKPVLLDEVKYTKNGKQKSIVGYDYQDEKDDHSFAWRGKGFLRIAKSEWRVALMNEKEGWAVIYFSKTLFTPEGVDIISKEPRLGKNKLDEIKELMTADSILSKHTSSFKDL